MTHELYMQNALNLAQRGLGSAWPNPSVGCVIVKDDEIIGRGNTGNGGRPHAEEIALKEAGRNAEGASVYVTLEPCAHKPTSCSYALAKAKVKEVIIACYDPDPRTNGKGIEILKNAGIKVTAGILENEAQELNKGFFTRVKKNRPFVTLKVAISADNKFLEARGGNIQWTTGELARHYVHKMREQHDAIIFGSRTVIDDNPQYTCRLPGLEKFSPQRVLVDRSLKVPFSYKIYAAPSPNNKKTWVFSQKESKLPKNAELFFQPKLTLDFIIKTLAEKGITRLMIETGPVLANAFLKENLVDEATIFVSPHELGNNGRVYFEKPVEENFKLMETRNFGEDKFLLLKKI